MLWVIIMKTEIWYSVQNCGDGSAYPKIMESKELCKLDQEFMDEGWGEPCIGSITIESNGPITVKNDVATIDTVRKELIEELEYSKGYERKEIENYIAAIDDLQV